MPRTVRQNSRKKINAFFRACVMYVNKQRRAPPRLKITLPTWKRDVIARGIDPDDVFDDYANWGLAEKIAREVGTSTEEELEVLWNKHKWRVDYRNKTRGREIVAKLAGGDIQGAHQMITERREGYNIREEDAAGVARAVQSLLTKVRSKGG